MIASYNGHIDVVRSLIAARADIHLQNVVRYTGHPVPLAPFSLHLQFSSPFLLLPTHSIASSLTSHSSISPHLLSTLFISCLLSCIYTLLSLNAV